jgi:type I restriction-modification system DNA methylase subunit
MRELKSDFLFMVGLVRDEQEGKPSMGWDLSLFKSSFYNKLAKLHKQGKNDQLKIIFDYMAEIENHFKLQKPVFTGKHKIWKLKPQENLEPDTSGKEYPNRPLRASDIPDELKVWIPDMQLKSMIGNDELWEVIDRLTQIVNKMPSTYQTENTPENDKIVYLHYFYGGHDWYIIEKDKGSDKDPDHLKGKQLQTFGYAILNQDYEMGEWGYISIEELNQAKWVELDFWFKPVKFGELKKKWQQSEQEEEQAPQREKIVPRPGTFLYGANWALDEGPVPAEYSTMLLTELRNKGFGIVKLNGESVELMKEGRPKFVLNDNGGEFNLFDDKTRNHITDIPYSINAHGRDFYPVEPDEIADSVDEAYEDYYTKTVDTEEQKPQNPKIKLSGNMRTMDMDQSKRLNIYFADQLTNVFDQMEEDDQLPIGFQYFNDLSSVMIHLEGFNFNIFDNSRKNANPENTYSIFFMTREGLKHEEIAVLNKSDFIKYDQLDGIGLAKAIIEKITTWIKKEKEFETGADQVYEPESHITQENPSSKQVAAAPDKYSEAEATATESLVQMYKGKKQSVINAAIQALLKKKGIDRNQYSADELAFIKLYEGAGGLSKEGVMSTGLLDQFYTPMDICAKMWGLALKNGFKFPGSNILEPAVGSGRFLQFIPADSDANVVAYDIDQTAYTLCKVLFPSFDIRHGSFEEMFFKGKRHIGLAGVAELFDLVIGNPPYREYVSPWAPLGEKEATGAFTFEMYFIGRGVDVLKPGGLLVMIVPNTFMSNDKKYNAFKEKLIQKADLVDGFRLPNGVFGNTEVGTDILVFRKK